MQVRNLLREDDAVSPVIGVILMVAITVILAAVIASFVLGLGGSQQSTPQASFSWDYTETDDTADPIDGYATVSHDGGDSIRHNELYFRGSGIQSSVNNFGDVTITQSGDSWSAKNATGSMGDTSAVVGGNTEYILAHSNFEISLVWEPQEGDTSATLSEETGPDA